MTDNTMNLYCDNVLAVPEDCDWSEGYGERWTVVVPDFETMPDDEVEAIAADYGCGEVHDYDEVRDCFEQGSEPMMNYRYPVTLRDFTPEQAAVELIGLPLTLIADDGEMYLALTGGGMDLSAEICKAYIALGQRPPVHFCDVPRMAGRKYSQTFLAVLMESCEVAMNWNRNTLDSLKRLSEDSDYAEARQ